jgi:signal transduction histidine kinase
MAVHQSSPRQWTEQEIALVQEVVERCWAHIERVRDAAMLRDQDRRKDEFLATLAHELRNPLAPIKYAVAMMRRSKDGSHAVQAQNVIDRQVSQMARLIDDLLDVSRINRGLIQLQRAPVSVAPLLQQALEVARPAIEAAHHHLEVRLPPEDLVIDADPTRIVQVISNLLGNAAKYTPDGGKIRLAAWRSGHKLVLEVADNGIGIAPENLSRMFTQGFTTKKTGHGFGLHISSMAATEMQGQLSCSSRGRGEGATFTLELPLEAEPSPSA